VITASSTTVLSNLAYLIGAVVVAVIIGLLVWLRHRQPKSVDANISSFRRGLSALAPEAGTPNRPNRSSPPAEQSRIAPVPAQLNHVRLESGVPGGPSPTQGGAESGGGETG
jgi:hypothetical protein